MTRTDSNNTNIAKRIKNNIENSNLQRETILFEDMDGTIDDMVAACERIGLKVVHKGAYSIVVEL